MTKQLSGPTLGPLSGGAPRQLVLLLHGYGSDGNDLIALGQHWSPLLPEALFVAPDAPTACANVPQGFEWFPVAPVLPIRQAAVPPATRADIVAFLAELWAETGLGAADTVLAGFSQGAMMALHVGLSLDDAVAGIISFSGALIPPDGFEAGLPQRPPVCLVHGDADDIVDPALSRSAAEALGRQGYDVRYHVSPGTAHGISPDGLEFATGFLRERLAAAPARSPQ